MGKKIRNDIKYEEKRLNVRMDRELLEKIDKIQLEYYFSDRSDAIRFLAGYGIKNLDLADKLLKKEAEDSNER